MRNEPEKLYSGLSSSPVMGARVSSVYSAHSPAVEATAAPSEWLSTALGPSDCSSRALRRILTRLTKAYAITHTSAISASRSPHSPTGVA